MKGGLGVKSTENSTRAFKIAGCQAKGGNNQPKN